MRILLTSLILFSSLATSSVVHAAGVKPRDPTSTFPGRVSCRSDAAVIKGHFRGGVLVDRSGGTTQESILRNVCFTTSAQCSAWSRVMLDRFTDTTYNTNCRKHVRGKGWFG